MIKITPNKVISHCFPFGYSFKWKGCWHFPMVLCFLEKVQVFLKPGIQVVTLYLSTLFPSISNSRNSQQCSILWFQPAHRFSLACRVLLNFFQICYKHFIIAGFCIETEISIFSRKRKTSGYLATTGPSFLPGNCGLGLSVSSTEHVLQASWVGAGCGIPAPPSALLLRCISLLSPKVVSLLILSTDTVPWEGLSPSFPSLLCQGRHPLSPSFPFFWLIFILQTPLRANLILKDFLDTLAQNVLVSLWTRRNYYWQYLFGNQLYIDSWHLSCYSLGWTLKYYLLLLFMSFWRGW